MPVKSVIKPVRGKPVTLRAVRPNAGIEAAYRARLDKLIQEMHDSLVYWLKSTYRRNEPVALAADETPAQTINAAMSRLTRRWQRRFNDLAPAMSESFAEAVTSGSDAGLRSALRQAGMTVKFTFTPAARDAVQAVIAENVGLIRSIASQHLAEVQGMLMRSVARGADEGLMVRELTARFEITKRRAKLIARDQNSKASAIIQQVRQKELGITEAIWMHSTAGHNPRPSHVGMNGKRYLIAEGMMDEDEGRKVLPGELINCRCFCKPVIPGLS